MKPTDAHLMAGLRAVFNQRTGKTMKCSNENPANSILYAVCKNEDETVTLTVFEGEKSAAVDLNKGLLKQLIETLSDSRVIQKDLLNRLYLGIMSLIQYVEAAPPGNTLRWFGDNRTPVKTLPDFGYARDAAAEVKKILSRSLPKQTDICFTMKAVPLCPLMGCVCNQVMDRFEDIRCDGCISRLANERYGRSKNDLRRR